MDEQDRTLWNRQQIDEGRRLLPAALTRGSAGPYAVQAAIAELHTRQPRDWPRIAALYETLARQTGSAVVEMNRAIAVAEIHGPEAGLAILDSLGLAVASTRRAAPISGPWTSLKPSPSDASCKAGSPKRNGRDSGGRHRGRRPVRGKADSRATAARPVR